MGARRGAAISVLTLLKHLALGLPRLIPIIEDRESSG